MGSWGHKTFENDGACDTLGNVFTYLVKQAQRDLKQLHGRAGLERPLLAIVAVLGAIVQKMENTRNWLKKDEVEQWRQQYFAWLESYRDILEEDFSLWKRNANREFNRLIKYLEN